jgi:hypothetical protein
MAIDYAIKVVDKSVDDSAIVVACRDIDRVGWRWLAGGDSGDDRNRIRDGAYAPAVLHALDVVASGRSEPCVRFIRGAAARPDDAFRWPDSREFAVIADSLASPAPSRGYTVA